MKREERVRRRKKQLYLTLAVALAVLAFLLHRQIVQTVFSPTVKGAFYKVNTDEKAVALTFDIVWEPAETGRILDILDRYQVNATFFVTGAWLRKNADLAREMLTRGHEIGQHGFQHIKMTGVEEKVLVKDFERMEETLREELNIKPELFRPPYGDLDEALFDFVSGRGYKTVLWSVNPHDWLDPGVDKIISRVVRKVHRGAIILFHTSATQSVDALPVIIQNLRMQEYRFLTVTELLELDKGGGR